MTRKQRNRDTDWLPVIDTEWPVIEKSLVGCFHLKISLKTAHKSLDLRRFFEATSLEDVPLDSTIHTLTGFEYVIDSYLGCAILADMVLVKTGRVCDLTG
ncbi:hypothetical protein [Serratia plymuthica]|uniref:hypothetical protein n=1 Tax=Serratia plymuthica TaxID=82996 RepID=UPI0039EEFE1A